MAFRLLKPKKRRRVTTPIGSALSVDAAVNPQRYDPDLAVLDAGSRLVSRGRMRSGFGSPPVVAYGQTIPANLRATITRLIPAVGALPTLRDLISSRV